jgi:hydrogenase maturation protease
MRFLHLLKHTAEGKDTGDGYRGYETWEEGRAREVAGQDIVLGELAVEAKRVPISFPEESLVEPGQKTIRVQKAIEGTMTISAERIGEELFKIAMLIENTSEIKSRMGDDGQQEPPRQPQGIVATRGEPGEGLPRQPQGIVATRGDVLLHSFVSTHTILQVRQGEFISLLETPSELVEMAKSCQNTNTWPVLIGNEGERDAMLSSPIILYDYPQIAPESIGTLFDGTEIDEILTLRIMTLTDEEKQEMRQSDERARELLERTEALTADDLMSLHGVIRNLHSVDEEEANR